MSTIPLRLKNGEESSGRKKPSVMGRLSCKEMHSLAHYPTKDPVRVGSTKRVKDGEDYSRHKLLVLGREKDHWKT